MESLLPIEPGALLLQQGKAELLACNPLIARYGLVLAEADVQSLALRRTEVLRETGRIELEGGVLQKLVYAFCDSPFLHGGNFAEALHELLEQFYYFKGEAMERWSDDELIDLMKGCFDGVCQGSLEYLAGTSLEELARGEREGFSAENRML